LNACFACSPQSGLAIGRHVSMPRSWSPMNRTELALRAMKAALLVRQQLQIASVVPVPVFDVAAKLGLEVWFVDVPTLEGMYVRDDVPTVLITSHRPAGRQAMTCAHEIGHHVFGHGSVIDEYVAAEKVESNSADEFLANTFAANLLMTRGAIAQGFLARGISATDPSPEQVYTVAWWLGVGYTALLYHMRSALRIMPRVRADALLQVSPKEIRAGIIDRLHLPYSAGELIPVDTGWTGRAIDGQVGDMVFLPQGVCLEGACGTLRGRTLELRVPGIGRVHDEDTGWAAYVRVSRRGYAGLADYRHLEDPEVRNRDGPTSAAHIGRESRDDDP